MTQSPDLPPTDPAIAASATAVSLLDITEDGVWDWMIESGHVVFSDRWFTMLGYEPGELPPHLSSWEQNVHPDDWPVIKAALDPHLAGVAPLYVCEHRMRRKDGTWLWIMDRGKVIERGSDGRPLRMMGTHTDVTWRRQAEDARERAESLMRAQTQILEMIAANEPLPSVLHAVLTLVEREAPEVLASVLVADEGGTVLRAAAAPSLPAAYCAAIDPFPIAADAGSCGTAAFRRERVAVEDIATDAKWMAVRDVALEHGLRACTSIPLLASDGSVLGTMAFYQRSPGSVAPDREGLLGFATHLTTLALERAREDQARRMREGDLLFLTELTGELQRVRSVRERGALGVRRLAEYLQLPVCGWSIVDVHAGTVTVQDFYADGEVTYRGDVVPAAAWPTFTASDDLLVFCDAQNDPVYGDRYAATFAQLNWRSSLAYGLFRGDAWVGVTYVSDAEPRQWTSREQQLMRLASERIWSALDVARASEEADRERRRLNAVLHALPVGVVIADLSGAFQMVNERVAEVWGGAPQANAIGEYAQYRGWWYDSGQPIAAHDWALARALTRGETSVGEVIRIARFDGSEGIMLNSAAPIRDLEGHIIGAVVITSDITEQMRLTHDNAQLQEASRRKSAFVSYLSHELRTPLNAILGFSELLHDQVLGSVSDLQREVLVDVLSSGRHLVRLLDDVLDTARIEAGKLELRPERIDLASLLDEVSGAMRPGAEAARLTLDVHADPAVRTLHLSADPARLRQVLYNFLGNAIKFTAPGGRVALDVHHTDEGMLRFTVIDTGIGIAPEDQARLFIDFEQVDSASRGGWGLGLALTRRLVEAHEGRVGLTSVLGKGSSFWADFPLQRE